MAARPNARIPTDATKLYELVEAAGSVAAAARQLGVPRPTLQGRLKAVGISAPSRPGKRFTRIVIPGVPTSTSSETAITSDDPAEWGDLPGLMESRLGTGAMNRFIIRAARVNEWGTPDNLARQLRVDLLPRDLIPAPAVTPAGWTPPTADRLGENVETGLTFYAGDHHHPHHDQNLSEAVIAWLSEFRPERGIILGDLVDYDKVSRHAPEPNFTATLQETINTAYQTLAAYRQASPGTRWTVLPGNHEDRLRASILTNIPALHDLRNAEPVEGEAPILSTRSLLRLDSLGMEYQDSKYGSYDSAQVIVNQNLAARHGWIAKKGSGSSALGTLHALGLRYSVIVGHTHRQSLVYASTTDINGKATRLLAAEAGTLAKIEGGLGYVPGGNADWQQGFATSTTFPDSTFSVDLATYTEGSLLWRNWHYRP